MLWDAPRDRRLEGTKFRRQVPLGSYTVDFACLEARLIVELDGPGHQDSLQQDHDRARDAWLRDQGFMILRFPNDVLRGGSGQLVLDAIERLVQAPSSDPASPGHRLPPTAPPAGEKERAAQASQS